MRGYPPSRPALVRARAIGGRILQRGERPAPRPEVAPAGRGPSASGHPPRRRRRLSLLPRPPPGLRAGAQRDAHGAASKGEGLRHRLPFRTRRVVPGQVRDRAMPARGLRP